MIVPQGHQKYCSLLFEIHHLFEDKTFAMVTKLELYEMDKKLQIAFE